MPIRETPADLDADAYDTIEVDFDLEKTLIRFEEELERE